MKWHPESRRERRWAPTDPWSVGSSTFRVIPGAKGPDDLRLERWTVQGWRPIKMAETFVEADFFHENEQWLEQARDHWRRPGGSYFLEQLLLAVQGGWTKPARRLEDDKRKVLR